MKSSPGLNQLIQSLNEYAFTYGVVMKKSYLSFLLIVLFSLSACALSPQVVTVDPSISTTGITAASEALTLTLDVDDPRESTIIGQRGGIYKTTSHIRTDENMVKRLESKLIKAFKDLGYDVQSTGGADAYLTVKTSVIDYAVIEEKGLNAIKIAVEIQAVCRKGTRQFSRNYSYSRKKDFVKIPSERENEKIVNEAMSVVLDNMLSDEALFKFINS